MTSAGRSTIRFTLNGRSHELSRDQVIARLVDVVPGPIRKHAVLVEGTWFPAIQAFEIAAGIPRSEFISHTARRHLAALGFKIRGDVETRSESASIRPISSRPGRAPADAVQGGEWHTEANVQAALVTAPVARGWRILSVANTATKEQGIDVLAVADDGVTVGIEVKGFPSRNYADPARAAEMKPTSPSTQAGHWYSQAVLAAMRLRGKEPTWRSVIALPDFPRYRALYEETCGSLIAAGLELWWVSESGVLSPSDLERS